MRQHKNYTNKPSRFHEQLLAKGYPLREGGDHLCECDLLSGAASSGKTETAICGCRGSGSSVSVAGIVK